MKRLLLALPPVRRAHQARQDAVALHLALADDLGLPLDRLEVRLYAWRGRRVEVTVRGWDFGPSAPHAPEAASRRAARRVWAMYHEVELSAVVVTLTDARPVSGGARVRSDEFTFFAPEAERADATSSEAA